MRIAPVLADRRLAAAAKPAFRLPVSGLNAGTIEPMPNIASILKEEIARVARKEMRADIEALRKASAQYRSTIAALKRRIAELEKNAKRTSKLARSAPVADSEPDRQIRFSAQRLKNHRAKLGLSAQDYGTLIGVSGLTVYKWEGGNTRPRDSQLPAIAAVRKLGKREAQARLAEA
jgi:DNA-binding transcriptional regulator YiaG